MINFLTVRWVEVGFALLIFIFLLLIAFVGICAKELIRKYDKEILAKELSKKEKEELKKMMPELPKEKK